MMHLKVGPGTLEKSTSVSSLMLSWTSLLEINESSLDVYAAQLHAHAVADIHAVAGQAEQHRGVVMA
jgi:hypothetical protein